MLHADALALLDAVPKASAGHGGVTILGGVPLGWRTGTRRASADPGWQAVWRRLGVISPWTVGAYADDAGADAYRAGGLAPDIAAARALGADLMPVVFPGFSWANLMTARHAPDKAVRNQIPQAVRPLLLAPGFRCAVRRCGDALRRHVRRGG